jgi:hypothetical protein
LAVPSRVQADVISDWNDIAVPLIRTAPNVTATRQLALVHVAQFEAVNAVVGKYTPYMVNTRNVGSLQQRIETSSDLVNWLTLTNYTSTDLSVQILDQTSGGSSHKFYRAVTP